MVVLSKDILTVPEDQIPTAQVMYTVVGGKGQLLQAQVAESLRGARVSLQIPDASYPSDLSSGILPFP